MKQEYELLKQYDDVLTFRELQKVLKASRNKTYQLLQDGTIPSRRLGTEYRILKYNVINYLYPNSDEK